MWYIDKVSLRYAIARAWFSSQSLKTFSHSNGSSKVFDPYALYLNDIFNDLLDYLNFIEYTLPHVPFELKSNYETSLAVFTLERFIASVPSFIFKFD
jgi:hypothetical protein